MSHTGCRRGYRVNGEQTYFFRGINGAQIDFKEKGGLTLSAAPDFPPKRVGIIRKNKSKLNWGGVWGRGKR